MLLVIEMRRTKGCYLLKGCHQFRPSWSWLKMRPRLRKANWRKKQKCKGLFIVSCQETFGGTTLSSSWLKTVRNMNEEGKGIFRQTKWWEWHNFVPTYTKIASSQYIFQKYTQFFFAQFEFPLKLNLMFDYIGRYSISIYHCCIWFSDLLKLNLAGLVLFEFALKGGYSFDARIFDCSNSIISK